MDSDLDLDTELDMIYYVKHKKENKKKSNKRPKNPQLIKAEKKETIKKSRNSLLKSDLYLCDYYEDYWTNDIKIKEEHRKNKIRIRKKIFDDRWVELIERNYEGEFEYKYHCCGHEEITPKCSVCSKRYFTTDMWNNGLCLECRMISHGEDTIFKKYYLKYYVLDAHSLKKSFTYAKFLNGRWRLFQSKYKLP